MERFGHVRGDVPLVLEIGELLIELSGLLLIVCTLGVERALRIRCVLHPVIVRRNVGHSRRCPASYVVAQPLQALDPAVKVRHGARYIGEHFSGARLRDPWCRLKALDCWGGWLFRFRHRARHRVGGSFIVGRLRQVLGSAHTLDRSGARHRGVNGLGWGGRRRQANDALRRGRRDRRLRLGDESLHYRLAGVDRGVRRRCWLRRTDEPELALYGLPNNVRRGPVRELEDCAIR